MIIKIEYFPEAEDAKDADAQDSEVVHYTYSMQSAEEALGKLQRYISNARMLKRIAEDSKFEEEEIDEAWADDGKEGGNARF